MEILRSAFARSRMERAKGIEPSYAAWEAAVLPLNYARKSLHFQSLRSIRDFRSCGHRVAANLPSPYIPDRPDQGRDGNGNGWTVTDVQTIRKITVAQVLQMCN